MAKKSRRARRQDKKKGRLPIEAMMAQALQRLDGGDARAALDLLREIHHKDQQQEGLTALLFCAYVQRARQLVQKEMPKEAEVMRARAEGCRTQVTLQTLSPAILTRFMRALSIKDAVCAYADVLPQQGVLPEVERCLADQLVVEGNFDAVLMLPDDHVLRQEAPAVSGAMAAMDQGEWAQAADALSEISRRSPFAPWRVFCRGMACFCAEDDVGAQRAAKLIPDDFVLADVAAGWLLDAPEDVRGLVWDGVMGVESLAQAFVEAVQKGQVREIEQLTPKLAHALYPENPKAMGVSLVEILSLAGVHDTLAPQAVSQLAYRLLPEAQAELSMGKAGLVVQDMLKGVCYVLPVRVYLSHLEIEFLDAPRQALARACVLEHFAKGVHRNGLDAFASRQQMMGLKDVLGYIPEDLTAIDMELMLASLEADPDNRAGYAFLLEILPAKRAAKKKAEQVLEEMMRRFPEDAVPCLELADLYYAKNAYRKAESMLQEAQNRAPHDERVLDRLAIGHLKSAEQSRNQKRWHLAHQSYAAADALARRRVAPLLKVKRWGLDVMERGELALLEVDQAVSALPPFEQLRLLALLLHDMNVNQVGSELENKILDKILDRDDLVDGLSSSDVAALLSPIDPAFELVFDDLDMAYGLSVFWDVLLPKAEGEDLLTAFEALLGCSGKGVVRREIDRRLKGVDANARDVVLLFYLAVIRHMEELDSDSRRFVDVLSRADDAQRKQLKAAALRLSAFADGALQAALRRFDFDLLDAPFPLFDEWPEENLLFDADDEDWDEDWDEDEDEDDASMLQMAEEMVDRYDLRGASMSVLKDAIGQFRSDAEGRRLLDSMARMIEPEAHLLSREARVLLFPKRRKRW